MAQLNDLLVMGQSTLVGPQSILGNSTFSGNLIANGSNTFNGITTLTSSLSVSGSSTFSSEIVVTGVTLRSNNISNHGGFRISGQKSGYHGILFGDTTNGLTIMSQDDDSGEGHDGIAHQGLYTQNGGGWVICNDATNQRIGLGGADTVSGYRITTNGNHYINGILYVNCGSSGTTINGKLTVENELNAKQLISAPSGIAITGGKDLSLCGPTQGYESDSGDIIFADNAMTENARLWYDGTDLRYRKRATDSDNMGNVPQLYVPYATSGMSSSHGNKFLRQDGIWSEVSAGNATTTVTRKVYVNNVEMEGNELYINSDTGITLTTNVNVKENRSHITVKASSTGGSTYTAGTNIVISNSAISTDLNPRFTSVSARSFTATSDRRLKENLISFTPKRSILDLPIYKYNFINDLESTTHIGCMAQDLQEICPELVVEDKDTGYLSIHENKIIYLLIDEVKKLKAEIEHLKCN